MITTEEQEKLKELRSVFPPNLLRKDLFEDDYFLIRWLRARHLDVVKASEMLEKSLKWREAMQADNILEREDLPEKYKKLYPTGLIGTDEEDCVGILLPLGRFNHHILLGNETMEVALRHNLIWVEKMMKIIKETEERTGKRGLRLVEVVDMEHYSYRELTYAPAREFIMKTNKHFDENYPEILKSCIVINAPKIFTLLFNFVKPFLSKETISKVSIYGGGNEEVWKEVLRSRFKPECVPRRWGGTRQGNDEFCSDDPGVWIDAPIPLSYFTNDVKEDGMDVKKIPARDKVRIELPAKVSDQGVPQLHWKFKVVNHDIAFGISFKPTNSDEVSVFQTKRIDSKQGVQQGQHQSQEDGVYTLIFDNKYSLTRSKTVHYSVQLIHIQDSPQISEHEEEEKK